MTAQVPRIRVAVVEDDPLVRDGLRALINHSPSCACVVAFGSTEEAVASDLITDVDVVLMDIQLPGRSGIECIRELKRRRPGLQIMMLTVLEDHDRIFQSLAAGASGYLLKQTPPDKLLESITELHRGGAPMSTPIARRVVDFFQLGASVREATSVLSAREREVLALLARGFLYKEIAAELGLSVETVRTHIHNTYEKLHVRTRTEAVMKVYGRTEPN
ncbi:MAG: response regulator transcription factor [Verrucomicrobiales bacterium]|nr:response regulator transcription factor [Verrucomicrobiales bacterium]